MQHALPLWKQFEYFKDYREKLTGFQGKDKATETLRKALYIISIGTDDFILNYFLFPIRSIEYNDLYNLGARKISVSGSPPMGCLPAPRNLNIFKGRTCFDYYNKVSRDFNIELKKLVDKLRKELDGIQVVFSDVYKPMMNMIQNPHLNGLEEVKRGCCGTGLLEVSYFCMIEAESFLCKDRSIYMYWDSIHATDRVYGIVADTLMNTSLRELI
ncbi:hypothetical protein MKW94_027039 [Papaver nudicaule]|uniref:GDSL esterase/lipase n=1 Tax=Papaver nudicaule TaxID=74823 RepID=A0AA42B012_PAPNU|nr:hypothetical protein [Papaver nudicaule]